MEPRTRVLAFTVSLNEQWDASGDRGGTPLSGSEREAWTPEHLVLAGLVRCSLASFAHHAGRAGSEIAASSGSARGEVTRRESDGRHAFVRIDVEIAATLAPLPEGDSLAALLAKAERDCFIGASLVAAPVYHWTIEGEAG